MSVTALTPLPSVSLLQPGDVGLDSGSSFFSWAVKLKTWNDTSHAWLYVGQAKDIPALASHHEPDSHWVMSAERHSVLGRWWAKLRGKADDRHEGVNYFPLDLSRTVYLLRAKAQVWDRARALELFESDCEYGRCRGSRYDTWGLFKSFYGRRFGRTDVAAYCSEVTRQGLEWGRVFVFAGTLPCEATAPGTFKDTPALECYWQRGS